MSIEWTEIVEKPEKSFKVPGQFLLEQRKKIESLQKALDELKSAKSESDQTVATLNLRIETLLADLDSKKKKIKEQADAIEELETKLANKDKERNQLTARIEELERLQKELTTSKDGQIAEQATKISELETQINELQQYRSKVEELEKRFAEASELQGKLSEREAELGTLQAKVSELEGKITELEQEKSGIEEDFQKKIESVEEEKKALEEKYKLVESEMAEKDAQISSFQSKIQELETNLAALAPPKPPTVAEEGEGTKPSACPKCESNRIKDIEDRSKILYIAAGRPIYAKKKRCLNCGTEWRVE
ncbi:MAG TPA: hypothetical protein VMV49_12325 [Candidatus Deferrimicrobium sp.]|nr:hypothetical protein [Candidatus Deferrimicrobium sp.]